MTTHARTALLPLALVLALNACSTTPAAIPAGASTAPDQRAAARATQTNRPADAFFQSIAALCGNAYAGRIVTDTPAPTAADPFTGKPLVMHVRECSADAIRIPFFVGDDRSRTWVLTRSAAGLQLKHDHRHQDGSEDAVTMYGGDTADAGNAQRQTFPADAESKAMFEREGRSVSNSNVWAMEVEPGRRFVYELSRPGRLFRVEFDLTRPLPVAPPPPWGSQ